MEPEVKTVLMEDLAGAVVGQSIVVLIKQNLGEPEQQTKVMEAAPADGPLIYPMATVVVLAVEVPVVLDQLIAQLHFGKGVFIFAMVAMEEML